jgi:hypothetical protein
MWLLKILGSRTSALAPKLLHNVTAINVTILFIVPDNIAPPVRE